MRPLPHGHVRDRRVKLAAVTGPGGARRAAGRHDRRVGDAGASDVASEPARAGAGRAAEAPADGAAAADSSVAGALTTAGARLPATVAERAPALAERLVVHAADALRLRAADFTAAGAAGAAAGAAGGAAGGAAADLAAAEAAAGGQGLPTALVANLPYNVAVPVVLHLLAELPGIRRGLVMVQAEVAERLAAAPGSRVYGVPSAKLAWYAAARRAGPVPRAVFWPVPGVDSGLLAFDRHDPPPGDRAAVFAVVDAAFAQRRKALRSALAGWAGSPAAAEAVLRAADVDPRARAETLTIADFARIAAAR